MKKQYVLYILLTSLVKLVKGHCITDVVKKLSINNFHCKTFTERIEKIQIIGEIFQYYVFYCIVKLFYVLYLLKIKLALLYKIMNRIMSVPFKKFQDVNLINYYIKKH